MSDPNEVKTCRNHQTLGGFSICMMRQVSCKRLVAAGQCPRGFKIEQKDGDSEEK